MNPPHHHLTPTPHYLILFWLLFLFSCTSSRSQGEEQDTLLADQLQAYGRFWRNKTRELELVSSAAHVGFSFEGTGCRIFARLPAGSGHNYLQYELDGVYQKKIRISGSPAAPLLITAPRPGRHTLWLYKATEAHTGSIAIQQVQGKKIRALVRPRAPLIEFIGNSITCGAAADPSEVPCGTGQYHDQHNAYQAYGPRVARALNASFMLSSVSGIGVYRNWNSNGPTMPQVYEKVDFQENTAYRWDFSRFTPQVVSIALGTNDFSNGDGKKVRLPFDSASFVNSYLGFVRLVKTKYPEAQLALLSSPMTGGKNRELLQNCLRAVKEKVDAQYPESKPVALHIFRPMVARGCTGHPNVEDHAILAQELVPFFRKLLL